MKNPISTLLKTIVRKMGEASAKTIKKAPFVCLYSLE